MSNAKNEIAWPNTKPGKRIHVPCIQGPEDYNSRKPVFSLAYMPYLGECCLSKLEPGDKASFADTILKLSQFAWKEIINHRHQSLGYEKIPTRSFLVPIPRIVTEDMEKLDVFRISEAGRMAGFRRGEIFHVVLVKGNHGLYRG